MSPRHALVSALHLFVLFAFFLAGAFFLAVPYLPELRLEVMEFFRDDFETSHLVGVGFLVTAFLLLAGFYALDRALSGDPDGRCCRCTDCAARSGRLFSKSI